MIIKRFWLVSASVCSVAAAVSALNAEEPGDAVRPSVRLRVEHTDNRDGLPTKEKNTDFSFIPRVDAFVRGERLTLNFFGEANLRYRTEARASEDDLEVYYDAGLNLDFKATPNVDMWARERYTFSENPAIVDDGLTLRRDSSYGRNRAEAGARLGVGGMSRVDVSALHVKKMYDRRAVARELDEEQARAKLSFGRQLSPTLRVALDGAYEEFDYAGGRGMKRGYSAVSGGLSATRQVAANAVGSLGLGYLRQEYDDSAQGSDSAPYARVALAVDRHPGMRISARGEYSLRSSDVYPFVSQTATTLGLDANWEIFPPRWTLEVGGAYRMSDYDDDAAPVQSDDASYARPVGGEENTLHVWGGLAFEIDSTSTLRLRQTHEDVDSDVSVSYARNSTRLEIGKSF